MRKMILFEPQPAPCQLSRRSRPLCVWTPLVVLAATTALFAVQLESPGYSSAITFKAHSSRCARCADNFKAPCIRSCKNPGSYEFKGPCACVFKTRRRQTGAQAG